MQIVKEQTVQHHLPYLILKDKQNLNGEIMFRVIFLMASAITWDNSFKHGMLQKWIQEENIIYFIIITPLIIQKNHRKYVCLMF